MDMTAFIQHLLEPRPAEELVDIQYNSILRRMRDKKWRSAKATCHYYRAMFELKMAELMYKTWVTEELPAPVKETELLRFYLESFAEQLLTPAPDRAALRWKKVQSYSGVSLELDEITRAIAEDEAWLSAHPVRRNSHANKRESVKSTTS